MSEPCSCCTHPGHPLNQEGDDDCWEEVFDLDEACEKAMERLRDAIDIDYECHRLELSEAALQDSMRLAARHFGLNQSSIDGASRLEKFVLLALLFGNNKNF